MHFPIPDTKDRPETVGQAALRLQKEGDQNQSVIETQREMQKKYIDNLVQCALDASKRYGKENPFYVCVQTRRERLLENVIRNQFYSRRTRPLPAYDLALYWYDPKTEDLRFVWCVPDRETCFEMVEPGYVPDPEHAQLYKFVRAFMNNTLI